MQGLAGVSGTGCIEELILEIGRKADGSGESGEALEVSVALLRRRGEQDHAVDGPPIRSAKTQSLPGNCHHPPHGAAGGQDTMGDRQTAAQACRGLGFARHHTGDQGLSLEIRKVVTRDQEIAKLEDRLLLGFGLEIRDARCERVPASKGKTMSGS